MDVLVENTTTQLHGIGQSVKPGQTGALTTPNLTALKPGINRVEEAVWAECMKQKMVQARVEEGTFVVRASVKQLSTMTAIEATRLIEKTFDHDLLTKWQAADNRKPVQDALAKQLAALEAPEPGATKPSLLTGKAKVDRE